MKYTCSKCGKEHSEWPAIGFNQPFHYAALNEEDKASIATLSDDLCVIKYEDQIDRFVRAVLHQYVIDDCQTLDYGIWVSLSEKSFNDYVANYKNAEHQATYFGYISNNLTGYDDTLLIKSNVVLRGHARPEVIPHDDQMDHPFVRDYYDGIDRQTAESRISDVINNGRREP